MAKKPKILKEVKSKIGRLARIEFRLLRAWQDAGNDKQKKEKLEKKYKRISKRLDTLQEHADKVFPPK
jgi:DNA topoisomerase VI subunit B